jgi:hypothetical protein
MNPPMMPNDLPAEPPAWPKAIGIFSIVWGSLAVICGVCGAIAVLSMDQIFQWAANMQAQSGRPAPQGFPSGPMPHELKMNAIQLIGAFISPIGGILLLAAGIFLVQRKPPARPLHLSYAITSLLGTLLGFVGSYFYMQSVSKYIASNPSDAWATFMGQQGGGPQLQFVQALVVTVIAVIYPTFVLLWFLFVKKCAADMGRIDRDTYV